MKKRLFLMSTLAVFALALCNGKKDDTTTSKPVESTNDEETQKLKEENETLKAEIEALNETKKTLEEENDSLKSDKTTLESEKSKIEKEIEYLKLVKSNYLKAKNSFEVTYVDFLGNTKTEICSVSSGVTLNDILTNSFNASILDSAWGSNLAAIDNSFIDNNWYIMIYENYELASTGLDGLEINAGDVFEFKHECTNTIESGWGTFDKYDVLVDQVCYNYLNNRFKNTLANTTTWAGSTYWEDMALYKIINAKNKYDAPLYDYNLYNSNMLNSSLVSNIKAKNVDDLKGTELFKFYYAARLTDLDLTDFKAKYSTYVESFTTYGEWGEYTIPFVTSTAKTLGLIDKLSNDVKNTTYKPDSTKWGPDGISWQLTGMASYKDLTDEDLKDLSFDKLEHSSSKDVSLSTMILPYAASNKDIRTLKNSDGVDVIQYLFDNYYNEEEMKFTTELGDDYSSNQIYAALIAYKVWRDTNKACNLFE